MQILWHKANPLELLNPENGWRWHCPTTCLKAEKAIYHFNNTANLWCTFVIEYRLMRTNFHLISIFLVSIMNRVYRKHYHNMILDQNFQNYPTGYIIHWYLQLFKYLQSIICYYLLTAQKQWQTCSLGLELKSMCLQTLRLYNWAIVIVTMKCHSQSPILGFMGFFLPAGWVFDMRITECVWEFKIMHRGIL